ncbi:MAG TPA: DUF1648 domain-containing protein [Ktedonobacteraceae bacterium]
MIWATITIQVIVAVYGFAVLPDTVPIHWGMHGRANGYGPKWIGTFLYPIIVPIIAVSIFLYIYSYICYQHVTREQGEPLSPPFNEGE